MMRYRGVVEGLERSGREVRKRGQEERSDREIEEELFDKDNALKSKTTQDRCLSLQPSKRLKSHLLFREEHPE